MNIYDNENYVLGCVALDNRCMELITTNLKPNDFLNPVNRNVYSAMLQNYNNNIGNDLASIYEVCKVEIEYLSQLMDTVPSIVHLKDYIDKVKEVSGRKQLKDTMAMLMKSDLSSIEQSKVLKDKLQDIVVVDNTEYFEIKDTINSYVDDLLGGKLEKLFHKTQYKQLNAKLGIENGNLILIAARPGVGKSAFALNLVNHFAKEKKVLFISLEMTKEEIYSRMLSLNTKIDNNKIKFNKMDYQDTQTIGKITPSLKQLKLSIYDKGGLKVEQLQNFCTKMKQQNNIDMLVVDYLGLLRTDKYSGSRVNEVGFISSTLKQIAMNLKIPVIALSQLSRAGAEEPQLVHLRDSGSLEQDANAVILLHDKAGDSGYTNRFVNLKIAKNRSGEIGTIAMNFRPSVMSFEETIWENNDDK